MCGSGGRAEEARKREDARVRTEMNRRRREAARREGRTSWAISLPDALAIAAVATVLATAAIVGALAAPLLIPDSPPPNPTRETTFMDLPLHQLAAADNVSITFEGGPQNGQLDRRSQPGLRMPAVDRDGFYGLSHEGAGGVLVYQWEG